MGTDNNALAGKQVLVLEDDYYLATDLQSALEADGAIVIGPFGDVAEAHGALAEMTPDCAFIDVNLGHGPSFEVPRALIELAVPFAFVTGYDSSIIPAEFRGVVRLEKPVEAGRVLDAATRLLHGELT